MSQDAEWISLDKAAILLGVTNSQMLLYVEQMDQRQIDGRTWVLRAHVDALSSILGTEIERRHYFVTGDDTEWIDIHEAAAQLGQTDNQIRRYAKHMEQYRIGSRIFLKMIDVHALNEELNTAPIDKDKVKHPFKSIIPPKLKRPSQVYPKPQFGASVAAVYKQGALNDQTHLTLGDSLTLCGEIISRGAEITLFLNYRKCQACIKRARILKLLCKGCRQPLIRRPRNGLCYSCSWQRNHLT